MNSDIYLNLCYNIDYEHLIQPIFFSFKHFFIFLKQKNKDVKYTIKIINSDLKTLEKELDSIRDNYKKFRYTIIFNKYKLYIDKKGNKIFKKKHKVPL